jgi:MFS family permease
MKEFTLKLASAFFSGFLLARVGVGRILAASCLLTGLALIGYTLVPHWWMMVLLGVFAGFGAGAIDASLNTYMATHFGEGLMQWLHASWGVGITLGPIIMTLGLTTRSRNAQAGSVAAVAEHAEAYGG